MRTSDLMIFVASPLTVLIGCTFAAIIGEYGFACTLALMEILAIVSITALDIRGMR